MILLIINNKPYHYEIIETIINKYNYIINTKIIENLTILLQIKDNNKEFKNYIQNKYPNIKINSNCFFNYDYLINCSIYSSDYNTVHSTTDKNNTFYICHDVTEEMKQFKNVYFVTPLSNNKYIKLDILPFQNEPKNEIQIATYIIQGELSTYRRDYSLLETILNNVYEYEYKFLIIGKGPICKELITLKEKYNNKIDIIPNLNFIDFHKYFLSCYCIFPCISKEKNEMYYTNKLTSSINYAFAYNLKILLDYELQSIYKCKNAYVYKKNICKHFNRSLCNFYKKNFCCNNIF